jgi:hypothetical protein
MNASSDLAPVWKRPAGVLALVAVIHAVLPLLLLGRHWPIGIDESVYLSQINAHVPPGGFSAPRARGATLLAAPVTAFTSAVAPMREWTAVLSGLGLFLGFRPSLRLRPGLLVPAAAALFASIWTVTYYGFQVMPNEWVAFAIVGGCGALLNFLLDGRRRSLVGAGIALAAAALLRPSDGGYALAALVIAALLCRTSWRRRATAAAVLVLGFAVGAADWVVEAFTTYGGLSARIAAAQAEQGGSGLFWSGGAQLRVLGGPVLCRTGCAAHAAPVYWLWWVAAAALLLVAVGGLRRAARPILDGAPLLLGTVSAAQYVFTVPYAAPRFLLPAYAALALPCAAGGRSVLDRARGTGVRRVVAATFVVAFLASAAVQVHVITGRLGPRTRAAAVIAYRTARQLRRAGVVGPCLVIGATGFNGPLAYRLECSNITPDRAGLVADLRHDVRVAWIRDTPPSHLWGYHWKRMLIQSPVLSDAYVSTSIRTPVHRVRLASGPSTRHGGAIGPGPSRATQRRHRWLPATPPGPTATHAGST